MVCLRRFHTHTHTTTIHNHSAFMLCGWVWFDNVWWVVRLGWGCMIYAVAIARVAHHIHIAFMQEFGTTKLQFSPGGKATRKKRRQKTDRAMRARWSANCEVVLEMLAKTCVFLIIARMKHATHTHNARLECAHANALTRHYINT